KEAAAYLEMHAANQRIASAWPFTSAITNPDFGYVSRPLHPAQVESFYLEDLAKANLQEVDVFVVYLHDWSQSGLLKISTIRQAVASFDGLRPQATKEEIRALSGVVPVARWSGGGQWIEIYMPAEKAASFEGSHVLLQ